MKETILNNLLRPSEPTKRYAVIKRPLGNNRFVVEDQHGRRLEVDSSTSWNVGEGVTVDKDGRIVDKSSNLRVKKLYQV